MATQEEGDARSSLYLSRVTFLAGDEETDRLLVVRLLRLLSFFIFFLWKNKIKVWFCDCGVELALEAKYLSGVEFEIAHSQGVDRWLSGIVLSDADVNFRGSAEEWYSQHFRVPGCPCRNGRSFYELKYTGAHPVMHLNTKTASRKYSCCLTGSQRKSFNKGLMWSNFPARSQYDTKVSINCNRFQFLPQKRGESHLPS